MQSCPHCLSTRVRLSRFRLIDYGYMLMLRFPYWCRDCNARFYRTLFREESIEDGSIATERSGDGSHRAHEGGELPAPEPSVSVPQERRAAPRFPCSLETYCYPSGKGGTQYLSRIMNLSCGGMKLFAEREFKPGDGITVRLRDSGAKRSRKFHVTVVHLYEQRGRDRKKGKSIAGCRFVHPLSTEEVEALVRESQ